MLLTPYAPFQSATTVALGHAHAGICEAMLTEVMMWVEEVLAEMEARKWKVSKGCTCAVQTSRSTALWKLVPCKSEMKAGTRPCWSQAVDQHVHPVAHNSGCSLHTDSLRASVPFLLQNQRVRREDMRCFMAHVYRLVALNLWPGVLPQRPWLQQLFLKFVDATVQHIAQVAARDPSPEAFLDSLPLRFSLASITRCLAVELQGCAGKRFDAK